MLSDPEANMAVHQVASTFSLIVSSHPPPSCLSLSRTSFKTHQQSSLLSTSQSHSANNTPLSLSNSPRKLLCRPAQGKYIEDDYVVRKLSAKEVQELVKGERKVPLIIDFYATWCGPCVLMAQQLETLAVEYEDNLLIVKVDTDDEYEFARDMQVRGLPTLFFFSPEPNKNAIRTEGLIPLTMMREIVEKEIQVPDEQIQGP